MKNNIHHLFPKTITPRINLMSYEDVLQAKIRAAKHRCESFQDCELWHEADMEIARYQAFEEALTIYNQWSI